MPLEPGTRLGPYEIVEPRGGGGMGTVYRARHTKLGWNVAIKVMHDHFAADQSRLARFDREARALASVNHPNIATLHGYDREGATHYLVMELVEGEDLADWIRRAPLSLEKALPLFIQIAEGLEAAHQKGVIHRDLKPANIRVTADGRAKILDFGLAKKVTPELEQLSADSTLTGPATGAGHVVGTFAYMSPEQARGEEVDRQTDIWAFGCVLYESLTGQRAFPTHPDSQQVPDWEILPPSTPDQVRSLLRRCIDRDRRRRLHDIADARIVLEEASRPRELPATLVREPTEPSPAPPSPSRRPWKNAWFAALGLGLLLAAAVPLAVRWGPRLDSEAPAPAGASRTVIRLPKTMPLATNPRSLALSPDGRTLVYVCAEDGDRGLCARSLGELEVRRLPGTRGAWGPFFSPSGEWVGFFAGGSLQKVPLRGGQPVTLLAGVPGRMGGSWSEHGTILFNRFVDQGLVTVSSEGGAARELTQPDGELGEIIHWYPRFLPGGDAALFGIATGTYNDAHVEVLSLRDHRRRVVIRDAYDACFVRPGHLVFAREGSIMAAPFDLSRLQISGETVTIVDGVRMDHAGRLGLFTVADYGPLIYAPDPGSEGRRRLVWVDEDGNDSPLELPPGSYRFPRLRPDGRQIGLQTTETQARRSYISIYDLHGPAPQRVTPEPGSSMGPVWAPDGNSLVFAMDAAGKDSIYRWSLESADGEAPRQLLSSAHSLWPSSWSGDGRYLAFVELHSQTQEDIWLYDFTTGEPPTIFLSSRHRDYNPMFSANGQWIAYVSTASGGPEVYLRDTAGKRRSIRLSDQGGAEPMWSPDGRRIFFRSGQDMMVVPLEAANGLPAGPPQRLFTRKAVRPSEYSSQYDVVEVPGSDRVRFLMVDEPEGAASIEELIVVTRWWEELESAH